MRSNSPKRTKLQHVLLTGGIGSGKSTVARIFGVLGIPVFEADKVGRSFMDQDGSARDAVLARFASAVQASGHLDRRVIAEIVFKDKQALADLNAIIHPAVRGEYRRWRDRQTGPFTIMEAAVVAPDDVKKTFDQVIVVTAPEAMRIQRVMDRDGVGEEAVRARMKNQINEEDRAAMADEMIVNDGVQLVIPQVLRLHSTFLGTSTP
ncbi:MAG: dephospho-CoA kinase [Flavobacteriales bacterium]|nr:dephospho-CoA kinase [Flavobacteriales bacterium]